MNLPRPTYCFQIAFAVQICNFYPSTLSFTLLLTTTLSSLLEQEAEKKGHLKIISLPTAHFLFLMLCEVLRGQRIGFSYLFKLLFFCCLYLLFLDYSSV